LEGQEFFFKQFWQTRPQCPCIDNPVSPDCRALFRCTYLFMMIATDFILHDRKGIAQLTTRWDKTIIDDANP